MNPPTTGPYHASQMYARNVSRSCSISCSARKAKDGKPTGAPRLVLDMNDEITKEIVVTKGGDVVQHARVRQPAGVEFSMPGWILERTTTSRRSSSACRPARSRPSAAPRARISSSMRRPRLAAPLPADRRRVRSSSSSRISGSTNGTLVNGKKVHRGVLRVGDTLRVGRVEFSVQAGK